MSSTGSRILFLLTDGNFYLPKLGKYNNILMQLNRIDISIQIIDLFYRNNCYGLTSPTFVNDIETMKMTMENLRELVAEKEKEIKYLKSLTESQNSSSK